MILAVAKIMALQTIRDRGAIALAFILPPLIFSIFATIFSGTGGSQTNLSIAIIDLANTPVSERLIGKIQEIDGITITEPEINNREVVTQLVERGTVENAIVIAKPADNTQLPPIVILSNTSTQMTGSMLNGQVQRLLQQEFPGITIRRTTPLFDQLTGGLTPEQDAALEQNLSRIDSGDLPAGSEQDGGNQPQLVEMELVGGDGSNQDIVSYFAGAIAFMFLLFSSMQAAISLIEERQSSIIDRVAAGPGGVDVLVLGKFLFLTLRGTCQVALIFLFAWIFYSVNIEGNFTGLLVVTIVAAMTASSLALFAASACTTRQQASAISSFVVLVFSAIGGSMIPRFLMPDWLQSIGWATPNAWIIEGYKGALFRGGTFMDSFIPLIPPLIAGAIALFAAIYLSRRRVYIS
ncbi:MAG: ABC transporter permease [Rhizobiaceae bacterium]